MSAESISNTGTYITFRVHCEGYLYLLLRSLQLEANKLEKHKHIVIRPEPQHVFSTLYKAVHHCFLHLNEQDFIWFLLRYSDRKVRHTYRVSLKKEIQLSPGCEKKPASELKTSKEDV